MLPTPTNGQVNPPPNGGQAQEARPPAEPTLAERLAADQDAADLDAQNRSVGAAEEAPLETPPPADPNAARFDKLEARFEEERADRKMERQMLLGALNRVQAPVVRVEQPPTKAAEPPPPSDEQLLEALKANPLGTIRQVTDDAVKRAVRETEERLRGEIRQTGERTTAQVQRQDQMRQGALAYQQQFSDILQSERGEDFDKECGQEIYSMYGDDWQSKIGPNTPLDVASRVYVRWARTGKIRPNTPTEVNGNARPSGLREIIRSTPTGGASDRAAGSNGAPRGGSRTPSTIGELGLNATEERAARRVMTQWGLDERTWVNNYLAAKADNPNFGNG